MKFPHNQVYWINRKKYQHEQDFLISEIEFQVPLHFLNEDNYQYYCKINQLVLCYLVLLKPG